MRPAEAAEKQLKDKNPVFDESLPRGPVPLSGSNPCTYIPGGGSPGRCADAAAGEF
ncbi:hypothetical protein C2S52_020075 [Perilla frutescens var. hirtella]|uniref:Uncharacterized protein n=1 Tax=Perilla frutescens var. hirtella TaxID=608512 RepID=A0AAD4J4P6_PERFH|nr:hypothetical protein C2S52_020075 [Perilla frutescens var. hirtella]KAH6805715.1 hypothetical protein C2S51_030546 [Perilla frutescens var. frutescens]KAH6826503.1 hypothetical protein C2S53_014716 [Perilla frutescens var. hirtella]